MAVSSSMRCRPRERGDDFSMKILLVHNSYRERGGEDIVFEQERDLLRDAGHEVIVYHRSNSDIKLDSLVQQIKMAACTVWSFDSKGEFTRLLAQQRPDIVHVHNTFQVISPSIYWACKAAHIPVVQTLHNYRLLCPAANLFRNGRICENCVTGGPIRGIRHGCYRGSQAATAVTALMLAVHNQLDTWRDTVDCFIALTDFSRKKFIDAGFAPEKIWVKPNFVRLDPGRGDGDGSYAIFVGRLAPEKGIHTLLAAWRRLHKPIPLRIVGDGLDREKLQNTATKFSLSNVSFEGRLERNDLFEVLKGARFLIFPSEFYESFGLGIIEAYACGRPVIASRLAAMQDMVIENESGLLFRAGDAADLADKVSWAWEHPEQMKTMGDRAYFEYTTHYTAEQNCEALLRIYSNVLACRSHGTVNQTTGVQTKAA